jgi:hypothetical protein
MVTGGHFYHEHIKSAVSVFGAIFNDMRIVRKDGKVLPIPISYGPRDKLLEGPKINQASEEAIDRILPRMSYELLSMQYDPERKLTNKQNYIRTPDRIDSPRQTAKVPVPYTLNFNLYIVTKNLNDGWQIIEQILPFFTPSYTVRVRQYPDDDNPETPKSDQHYDLPIVLTSMSWADDYQGNITEKRIVEWSLEFDVKINLFGPVTQTSVILDSRVSVAIPEGEVTNADKNTQVVGSEVGYVNLDSENAKPTFNSLQNITNLFDSEGYAIKVIRELPEDL